MGKQVKVILIHGNGNGSAKDQWFPYVKKKLEKLGVEVIARDFPDPVLARAKYWIPFLKKLGADENTILIGHSSGAVAAMRFAEGSRILGSVLVSACYTDLGDEMERKSGYYDKPWNWTVIKRNQKWIIQFASKDDPWISIEEARFIHKELDTEYYEYEHEGHFGADKYYPEFPKLVEVIKTKLGEAFASYTP